MQPTTFRDNGDWTLVTRRHKKKIKTTFLTQFQANCYDIHDVYGNNLSASFIASTIKDIERIKLRLENSGFWTKVKSLQCWKMEKYTLFSSSPHQRKVSHFYCLGLGKLSSFRSKMQFSLLLLIIEFLRQDTFSTPILKTYDPVYTVNDIEVLKYFGFDICSNKNGRYALSELESCPTAATSRPLFEQSVNQIQNTAGEKPATNFHTPSSPERTPAGTITDIPKPNFQGDESASASKQVLFYMPHCMRILYNNIMESNWNKNSLKNILLVGNSFQNTTDKILCKQDKKKWSILIKAKELVDEYSLPNYQAHDDVFNDTVVHVFSEDKLNKVPISTWKIGEGVAQRHGH
ncbi:uncharacterized protein LOC126325857 [Schistocerca gregaria]|uniref:uncharacterized protein LOC126325857 n=1 Tax=Schistocerca gregaria TaxID=7010 RepID=UPI00211E05E6|nr:uncharacterized protein LOC126325857 [Schistocerca gregaria]